MKERENMLDENNMTLRLEKIGEKKMDKNLLSKNELSRKRSLQEKGITLIALVVTIIILLILAGVTLNMALSQNGLFSKTQEAAEKYKQAQRDEEDMITEIDKQFRPIITTLKDFAIDNVDAKDSLGNLITIPKGFKIIEGSTVKEGIVIQDSEGNEFVWIPVSNIDGDNDAKTKPEATDLIAVDDSNKVEITLGRYTFDTSNGNPTLVQKGSEYSKNDEKFVINEYYKENSNDGRIEECKSAKNLKEFVDSVKKNHGYYIARYEAGTGIDGKPISKPNEKVWNKVTQSAAADAARKMYTDDKFESDLVNSYAWDTAIVYMQLMGNTNYANKRPTTANLENTGSTRNNDVKCNIYDMAGNVSEWTTEYSVNIPSDVGHPCVLRGSSFDSTPDYTAVRASCLTTSEFEDGGIRPILYLK